MEFSLFENKLACQKRHVFRFMLNGILKQTDALFRRFGFALKARNVSRDVMSERGVRYHEKEAR